MMFDNSQIRRQDRLLAETACRKLLKNGEYGVLSVTDLQGNPYGIPINYVWDGNCNIYLHCAPVGKKLSCIRFHNRISFCIIGHTKVIPEKFTTEYESVILQGKAVTGLSTDEKLKALRLLVEKYSPDYPAVGMKYAEKSLHRTEIIRLELQA